MLLMLTTRRLGQHPQQKSQDEAGNPGRHERRTPAPEVVRQVAADKMAGGAAHEQAQKENGEHAATLEGRKRVGNQGRRYGGIAGFTNSNNGVAEEQLVVVMHEPGKESKTAPDHNAEDNNIFAGKTVSHPADQWSGKHIGKKERTGKDADLVVAHQEFFFYVGLHRKEHVAVNIVKDVQSGQHRQQKAGIEFWRHG